MGQKRKIPLRKCVVTGEMKPKKELVRVVRNKEGEVFVDSTGKKNGRGAYITLDTVIIKKAEETNLFGRHLNAHVHAGVYEDLRKLAEVQSDGR